MFDAEKLVTTPIDHKGGMAFLRPDGSGCAIGLAYVACHESVNWKPAAFSRVAQDNMLVVDWLNALPHDLRRVLDKYELMLMRKQASPEKVKADMIQELDATGWITKKVEVEVNVG